MTSLTWHSLDGHEWLLNRLEECTISIKTQHTRFVNCFFIAIFIITIMSVTLDVFLKGCNFFSQTTYKRYVMGARKICENIFFHVNYLNIFILNIF